MHGESSRARTEPTQKRAKFSRNRAAREATCGSSRRNLGDGKSGDYARHFRMPANISHRHRARCYWRAMLIAARAPSPMVAVRVPVGPRVGRSSSWRLLASKFDSSLIPGAVDHAPPENGRVRTGGVKSSRRKGNCIPSGRSSDRPRRVPPGSPTATEFLVVKVVSPPLARTWALSGCIVSSHFSSLSAAIGLSHFLHLISLDLHWCHGSMLAA